MQKLALASYFGQITAELSPAGEPQPDAVKLFLNTLYILANTDKNVFQVKAVFEMRLMMCQGYMPDVFSCSGCGGEHFPFYFDIKNANIFCDKCGKTPYELTEPVVYALRYVLTCEQKKMFSFEMDEALYKKLADISKAYVISVLGYIPKTLEYFEGML